MIFPLTMVFDMKLEQPACVLLQAVYGGSIPATHHFNEDAWLLSPTKDMVMVSIKDAKELERIKKHVNDRFPRKKRT